MSLQPLEVLAKYQTYAIVGATTNTQKYGYKIFKVLKDAGYEVYPVNPNYAEIDHVACVPDLQSLNQVPDVIVSVVSPPITLKVIESAKEKGSKVIWMPPGAWSEETIQKCVDLGLPEIHEACVILAVQSFKAK